MSTTANQQFEGASLEEALEAAVASLGDQLQVIDAQRVRRRGILGMRRRERYEVTATNHTVSPHPAAGESSGPGQGFDDVLRRMVDRVDEAERAVGSDLADTDRSWWSEADFVLPERSNVAVSPAARHQPKPAADFEVDVRLEPARASAAHPSLADQAKRMAAHTNTHSVFAPPTPAEHDAPPPSAGAGTEDEPGNPAPSAPLASPAWSREALLGLELPPALVGRMRIDELGDDLAWVSDLSRAIGELLETASHMSGPCELTGHGAVSAVHLLRGACDGFRLDSLIIDGRRVAATPLELALAVRSLLPVRSEPQEPADPVGVMALVEAHVGNAP